jgi:hypothetical protein
MHAETTAISSYDYCRLCRFSPNFQSRYYSYYRFSSVHPSVHSLTVRSPTGPCTGCPSHSLESVQSPQHCALYNRSRFLCNPLQPPLLFLLLLQFLCCCHYSCFCFCCCFCYYCRHCCCCYYCAAAAPAAACCRCCCCCCCGCRYCCCCCCGCFQHTRR